MKQTFLFGVLIVALLSWIAYSQMQILRLIDHGRFPVSLADPIAITGKVDANIENQVEVTGKVDANIENRVEVTVSNSPLEIEGVVEIMR